MGKCLSSALRFFFPIALESPLSLVLKIHDYLVKTFSFIYPYSLNTVLSDIICHIICKDETFNPVNPLPDDKF